MLYDTQAAAGVADHEAVNMDTLGTKSSTFDRSSGPQIAGNLAPPSENKPANGGPDTVRALAMAAYSSIQYCSEVYGQVAPASKNKPEQAC